MKNLINGFIGTRAECVNISCKTLIVTVFGDVISQHGHWIWLGSLISALSSLGYSERLVRTSVFRLVDDDWLQVKKIGRKSYYSLSTTARKLNEKAAKRIYSPLSFPKSDDWLIVLPSFVPEEKLSQFKRQLKWLGFSSIGTSTYAHPSLDKQSLEDTISEMDLINSVIIFSGKTIDDASTRVLKKLVYDKWNLSELQNQYDRILTDYKMVLECLNLGQISISPLQSFLLRVLLIHEFRRILLKDHELSKNMLPSGWSGEAARILVMDIYKKLEGKSIAYIKQNLESVDGLLALPSDEFYKRFDYPLFTKLGNKK